MKKHLLFVLTGCSLLAGLTGMATAEPQSLGQFGDWSAFKNISGKTLTCFILSRPTSKKPEKVDHGDNYFMVSQWPREKIHNQISISSGYAYKKGSITSVTIGTEKFNLFTKGKGAWAEHRSTENRMVKAMKLGSVMKVNSVSARGTRTSYTYSLKGVTAALQQLNKECR